MHVHVPAELGLELSVIPNRRGPVQGNGQSEPLEHDACVTGVEQFAFCPLRKVYIWTSCPMMAESPYRYHDRAPRPKLHYSLNVRVHFRALSGCLDMRFHFLCFPMLWEEAILHPAPAL